MRAAGIRKVTRGGGEARKEGVSVGSYGRRALEIFFLKRPDKGLG